MQGLFCIVLLALAQQPVVVRVAACGHQSSYQLSLSVQPAVSAQAALSYSAQPASWLGSGSGGALRKPQSPHRNMQDLFCVIAFGIASNMQGLFLTSGPACATAKQRTFAEAAQTAEHSAFYHLSIEAKSPYNYNTRAAAPRRAAAQRRSFTGFELWQRRRRRQHFTNLLC